MKKQLSYKQKLELLDYAIEVLDGNNNYFICNVAEQYIRHNTNIVDKLKLAFPEFHNYIVEIYKQLDGYVDKFNFTWASIEIAKEVNINNFVSIHNLSYRDVNLLISWKKARILEFKKQFIANHNENIADVISWSLVVAVTIYLEFSMLRDVNSNYGLSIIALLFFGITGMGIYKIYEIVRK